MKKFLLINVCLVCIACTKQYYDNKIVNYYNYLCPQPLCIDTDDLFLTDDRFDAGSCDTMLLYKLNKETGIKLEKRINEMFYESNERRDSLIFFHGNFFLYGKLDLQPNVKSLILLEYSNDTLFNTVGKDLWLINIKDDKLHSIVWLDNYFSFIFNTDIGRCYTIVCLENKIFTETRICTKYFFNANIGEREWNSYESKVFAQYKVNEAGYIEFVER
jgi:hypothetical protein